MKMDQCIDFISDHKLFLHPHIELGYGRLDRKRGIWWQHKMNGSLTEQCGD